MHQIRFGLGLCPRPRWGDYSAPQTPIAGLVVLLLRGGEAGRRGRDRMEGKAREAKGR